MNKVVLALVAAAMSLSAGSAMAQKKQLVIVVKGLDNPFFEAINQGCQKWNKENASSPYHCFYTGPASTSDEAGEAQIVGDMLGKSDTVAIAISPSNAPSMRTPPEPLIEPCQITPDPSTDVIRSTAWTGC